MRRKTAFLTLGVLGISVALLGALQLSPKSSIHRAGIERPRRPLPALRAPRAGDRVLILAPHCDDETLACGGVIMLCRKRHIPVSVVLLTNGDGFWRAAERAFDEVYVTPEDYLRLGVDRQKETLAAVAAMGLPSGAVTFLGYPDGGTASMWANHWEATDPYTSPRTRDYRNPYRNSLRANGVYCGRNVVDDLKAVIQRFQPTIILCPHPDDTHPDHWAARCYALAALYELGLMQRVRTPLYLVHRGEWPVPRELRLDLPLTPPSALTTIGTRWEALGLSPADAARKRQAIERYRTQLVVMRSELLSFARRNELFGELPLRSLSRVGASHIKVDGDPADWRGIPPLSREPAQDLSDEQTAPAGDLVALFAATDGQRVYVRADLYGEASPHLRYTVYLHPLTCKAVAPPLSCHTAPAQSTPGVRCRTRSHVLEASLPIPDPTDFAGIMVGVDSRFQGHLLDKTAWVMATVTPAGASSPGPEAGGR